ncbi:cellulase N-terminal Ig-like domain-containing protein [Spirosoma aerophilum]
MKYIILVALVFSTLSGMAQPAKPLAVPLVNQAGYNRGEAKRFVCYEAADGTPFQVIRQSDKVVVFTGTIRDRAGDFSALNPKNGQAAYIISIKGREPSVPFRIADHLIESVSSKLAYDFFVDVRGSEDPVHSNEAKVYGGGPSRDQGSFGLETTFETLFYASNPALFDRWTTELGDKKTADLIDLILWHGEFAYHHVDYNGPVATRHGTLGYEGQPRMNYDYWNTLDQLAAVCAGYHTFLKPYLSRETYLKYRDECRKRWQTYDRHKVVRHWTYSNKWVDEGFQEFNEMGNAFGQSVFSNLFMYLSEKEEADGQPDQYLRWAQESAEDIIKNWDFNNPRHMWWIRNAEHITPQALAFFLLVAPNKAPKGTREKLMAWRDHMKQKTANFWHYRVHSDTEWAHPRTKELGGAPALGGSMFAVAHLLGDRELRDIGWSQVNFVFGLNPIGAHLSNKSADRLAINGYWDGVEHGWPRSHPNGYGMLGKVRGTLDGTPLDAQFPRPGTSAILDKSTEGQGDHIGQNAYATEGWAISNRGWLATITFAPLGTQKVRILDTSGKKAVASGKAGQAVLLELTTALNLDPANAESGWVLVSFGDKEPVKVAVQETAPDSGVFTARYTLPSTGAKQLRVSYGYWGLGSQAICTIR